MSALHVPFFEIELFNNMQTPTKPVNGLRSPSAHQRFSGGTEVTHLYV